MIDGPARSFKNIGLFRIHRLQTLHRRCQETSVTALFCSLERGNHIRESGHNKPFSGFDRGGTENDCLWEDDKEGGSDYNRQACGR